MSERPATQAEINAYRRRSIIDGTLASLSERGITGTTIRSICGGDAGSRGLIAHYFNNKEALLAAAFIDLMQSITTAVEKAQARSGDDPVTRLKVLAKTMFSKIVFSRVNQGALLTFWHEIRFNPAVRRANQDLYRDYSRQVETLFALAAKRLDLKIDVASAALGLIAMIDGLWLELSIQDRVVTRKRAISLCCDYIDQQLVSRV